MRPRVAMVLEAKMKESRKRKFSATVKTALVFGESLVHASSSWAVAMSFATGFSARTCFPAARAFLM